MEQRILEWLSPPDPWKNHNIARKSRHRGSAAWFVQGNTFSNWKSSEAPGSLLWVHGKRPCLVLKPFKTLKFPFLAGAGKSVLWYVELFVFLSTRTYRAGQFRNHRGH